jgi:hypothetical protein
VWQGIPGLLGSDRKGYCPDYNSHVLSILELDIEGGLYQLFYFYSKSSTCLASCGPGSGGFRLNVVRLCDSLRLRPVPRVRFGLVPRPYCEL